MDWRRHVIAILTLLIASVYIVYVKAGGLHNDETCQKDTDCCSDSGVQCLQDGTSRKCLCQTDEFLDKEASVCRKKIHFMWDCQAKTDHCATEGAVCRPVVSFGQLRCACETDTEYFNANLQQCMKKIHFMGDCQAKTDHCATEGAVCRPVGSFGQLRCACETDTENFNADLQQCRKEIHFMGNCQAKTDHCATEGAVCRPDGSLRQLRCACETDTEYFNADLQQCRKNIHFRRICQAKTDHCATEGAVCRPVDSFGQLRCACETDTEHFNANLQQCRKKIHFMGDCQAKTDHCATEGAVCRPNGSFKQLRCVCETDTEYFNADLQQCRKKIAFGERCQNWDDVCLVDGASCQYGSNKCICDQNHFLDTESAVCRRMPDIENGHWRQSGNLWENMGEKWIMSCNDGYFVDGCAVVRNYQGKWNRDMPKCLSKTANWAQWCAKNAVGLVYQGIHYARIAGSAMVELMRSIVTILKGGGVVPDSMVDTLQLEGVLNFTRVAKEAIGRAGSARAAATQFLLWNAEGCEEV